MNAVDAVAAPTPSPSPWTGRLTVSEGRFNGVVLTFMALGFLMLAAAGFAALRVIQQAAEHRAWVDHTYQVELSVQGTERTLERLETTRRGYLLAPGPVTRGQMKTVYGQASRELTNEIEHVRRLTADNPRQQASVRALRPLLAAQLDRQQATMRLADADPRAATASFVGELDGRRMLAIRGRLAAMFEEERRLLMLRNASLIQSIRLFDWVLGVAATLLGIVAAISFAVIRRFTRDLTASRDRLRVLNDTLEQRVVERTADLTRANDEIQRFAYIVSHDLRSPLVNVMGFTSELEEASAALTDMVEDVGAQAPALLSREAARAAREELPEAIGFIRASTQKMDRLIAAILKLSREGRRVIAPERLDMDALVGGIRDSVRHILDRDGATLTIETPLPGLVSDRVSVEQILSNLIENAVKYLQPGRPGAIHVRGRADAGRVTYEVVDNGRGIAAADRERVFELFRRSGAQDKPGEGIGLAHVRPLAARLGGTVDMTSELGQGSTFRLILPADYRDSRA